MEARLVPEAGFCLRTLKIGALKQVSWPQRLRTVIQLPASFVAASGMLAELRPKAVFSMGGYASGPVALMALLRAVPVVVMEPNAFPGFTHRIIGRFVSRALLGFEQAQRFFPPGRSEVTGIPIRKAFFHLPPKLHQAPFTVLITGGSQGSHRLNYAATESVRLWERDGWLDRIVFLHQSGEKEYNDVCSRYRELGAHAEVAPFLDDMPAAFARADVVVCRSGASTVAELSAAGKAALLVPFPFAADQHQLRNAQAMQAAGAARLVEDRDLTGPRFLEELRPMLLAPERLTEMEAAARRLARSGAAERAAEVLETL
jgi:UDP-N-acetylglucosamine--N-acetylmuramyl-(pentapeptide) pyrophosphoryl-undecaprenol N-acetylglucosamine transferase